MISSFFFFGYLQLLKYLNQKRQNGEFIKCNIIFKKTYKLTQIEQINIYYNECWK